MVWRKGGKKWKGRWVLTWCARERQVFGGVAVQAHSRVPSVLCTSSPISQRTLTSITQILATKPFLVTSLIQIDSVLPIACLGRQRSGGLVRWSHVRTYADRSQPAPARRPLASCDLSSFFLVACFASAFFFSRGATCRVCSRVL